MLLLGFQGTGAKQYRLKMYAGVIFVLNKSLNSDIAKC